MNHFVKTPPAPSTRTTNRRSLLIALLVLALVAGACSANTSSGAAPATTDRPEATSSTVVDAVSDDPEPTDSAPADTDQPDEPDASLEPDTQRAEAGGGAADVANELHAELNARGFTGTVIVQAGDASIASSVGSADWAANLDHDSETVFDIGSITKQFTAAAILRLEMDGALRVEDTVGQYVDGLTPELGEITLHQLLTHTAGLPSGIGPDDEAISLPDYIARLADTPLLFEPGEVHHYSNVGYSLLGAVIESVTSGPYEQYLHQALFEPAGMMQTGYVLPDWGDATIAVGYVGDEVFGRPNEEPWDVDGPWWNLRANGGLLSTMPDLLRWDEALRTDVVLDAEAKEKMYAPHVAADASGEAFYGYGWVLVTLGDGSTLITHAGGNHVFFADFLRFVDQDLTIVLASNVADPGAFDLGFEIASALLDPAVLGDIGDAEEVDSGICEIDVTTAEVAGFEAIADYPETPAGQAMAGWLDVLLAGNAVSTDSASAIRLYLAASVDPALLEELGIDGAFEIVRSLQAEFDGFALEQVHQESDATFHVLIADSLGDQMVISASVGNGATPLLECLAFNE